jgi:MFS superfamily sulfate permease-like transporter
LVAVVTVLTDLAVAVLIGVIVSALTFAWAKSKHINVSVGRDAHGWKVYLLDGPLFFGSVSGFRDLFDPRVRGTSTLKAEVLADNVGMLKVFERAGLPMQRSRDGGVVHVELSLKPNG